MRRGDGSLDRSKLDGLESARKNAHSTKPNIYAKNRGTSYLVAPLNVSTNPKMIKI